VSTQWEPHGSPELEAQMRAAAEGRPWLPKLPNNTFFVDCESVGEAPCVGYLTEFAAVHYGSRQGFHGILPQRHDNTLRHFNGLLPRRSWRSGQPEQWAHRPLLQDRAPCTYPIPVRVSDAGPRVTDNKIKVGEWNVFEDFGKWIEEVVANSGRPTFVSDNPAFDWQWINHGFWEHLGKNPFGHSARRIGDFYAGLVGDWKQQSTWKSLRQTRHDHNPVNDVLGNVEAVERMLKGERGARR
jgi:hypothetical protein